MVGEGLDDQVLAHQVALEQQFLVDALRDVLLGEEGQAHVLHERRGELLPHRDIVAQPGDHALVDTLLVRHGDPVVGNQADDLLVGQIQKLIELDYLAAKKAQK